MVRMTCRTAGPRCSSDGQGWLAGFRLQVLSKFVRRYIPLGERGEDFGGGIVGEASTCSFNHKGVAVCGEGGRKEP